MDALTNNFIEALREAIRLAGTQAELAKRAGMQQSRISDYLSCRYDFDNITVGALGRLLMIKVDEPFKNKKLTELIGEVGVGIFSGDGAYVKGTPVYNLFSAVLKRFSFIIKKVEPKLEKDGVKVDLKNMLLNTIGNNKGYSDNNAKFILK